MNPNNVWKKNREFYIGVAGTVLEGLFSGSLFMLLYSVMRFLWDGQFDMNRVLVLTGVIAFIFLLRILIYSYGYTKAQIGGYKPYKALIHKKIPIRSIGIEVMPAYYEDYLQKQYPGDYISPLAAFRQIDQTTDFPAMAKLLHEVKVYRGDGIAAGLFYEAKVAEAVSLVVEEQKKILSRKEKRLSEQDVAQLKNVIAYLNDHYAFDIPLERLAKIACMGTTKLKTSFKQLQGCTITEYIQQRRMSQAEHLLIDTDFTMGQIAEMIGYSTSSRFAELFRKSTGLLPIEYRKMAQQK